MRKLLVISAKSLLLLFIVFTLFGHASAEEKLKQIAEDVYAYEGIKDSSKNNSFGANAGIIIGKDGIVVVDAMISAKQAKSFIRDIQAITHKPIRYVVNTHYHFDHVFGNAEFAKLGAVIIAQENARKAMQNSAEETLQKIGEYGFTPEDMEGTTLAYPVLTYGDRMTIDIGGHQIELIHARHSHTDGDTVVYIPDKKVLFAGDILFTNYHPFLGEANIEEWVQQLDDIRSMDIEKIVPGHGPLSGKKDLDDMKEYILLFDQKAKELASESDDLQKIVSAIQSLLPQRPEAAWLIAPNIQMKYLKTQ